MKKRNKIILIISIIVALLFLLKINLDNPSFFSFSQKEEAPKPYLDIHEVEANVTLGEYFDYMDTLIASYDTLLPYNLDEYLLVHANNWIIDTLEHTDYYYQMEQDSFVYDFSKMIILKENDSLFIPTEEFAATFRERQQNTIIDVNIPEYKLRILEGDSLLYTFPVRVGRHERKYLAMAKNVVDLRTRPGKGKIVRINKNPRVINPSDNKEYFSTKRDDGKRTLLSQIPWIEPEINGTRYGQLIHPTTNPNTLGKAYSNGCVGMKEGDAWRLYYHAPLETQVVFRYDLEVINEQGDTIYLKDIYNWEGRFDKEDIIAFLDDEGVGHSFCYCR